MNYLVKVKVTPSDPNDPNAQYKSKFFTGQFVPKGKRAKRDKIEDQVKAYLLKNLKTQDPEMTFDVKIMKVDGFNNSFVVVEDKE